MQFYRNNHTPETLVDLYRKLLYPRMIEEKMLLLLRQGKISKWFSGIGQEAIAVLNEFAHMVERILLAIEAEAMRIGLIV